MRYASADGRARLQIAHNNKKSLRSPQSSPHGSIARAYPPPPSSPSSSDELDDQPSSSVQIHHYPHALSERVVSRSPSSSPALTHQHQQQYQPQYQQQHQASRQQQKPSPPQPHLYHFKDQRKAGKRSLIGRLLSSCCRGVLLLLIGVALAMVFSADAIVSVMMSKHPAGLLPANASEAMDMIRMHGQSAAQLARLTYEDTTRSMLARMATGALGSNKVFLGGGERGEGKGEEGEGEGGGVEDQQRVSDGVSNTEEEEGNSEEKEKEEKEREEKEKEKEEEEEEEPVEPQEWHEERLVASESGDAVASLVEQRVAAAEAHDLEVSLRKAVRRQPFLLHVMVNGGCQPEGVTAVLQSLQAMQAVGKDRLALTVVGSCEEAIRAAQVRGRGRGREEEREEERQVGGGACVRE